MRQSTYQRSRTNIKNPRTGTSRAEWKSLLLFYILPFIIVNGIIFYLATAKPKYDVAVGETHDYLTTDITFTIKSYLPTKNLSISINATPLELEKTGRKTYKATISQNGILEVSLDNFNGMTTTLFENINILDDDLPTLTSHSIENGILSVTLADSQSGIDFSSIHAIDSTGTMLAPLSVDKANAHVTFEMDPSGITLYASDMSGNVMETPISLAETEPASSESD